MMTAAERVQARIARWLIRLPRQIAGEAIERDGHTLDGQVQIALALARLAGRPVIHESSIAVARRELEVSARALAVRTPAMAYTDDRTLDGPGGPIAIRIHRPAGIDSPAPALVYFHGGGFVVGSIGSHGAVCRALAAESRAVVIAVDYRLAPESRFPAAADDALAAFRAIAADARWLGIDSRRIAVGGDSAGGNLAAGVSLETRGDPVRPCFQLLVYPWLDLTMSFPSVRTMGRGFFLERASLEWFAGQYLDSPDAAHDPRASPWLAENVRDVPAAFVMTAGFDPLRDEGDAYAARLRTAGVGVEHRCYGPLFHGFMGTAGGIDASREALSDAASALRRTFLLRVGT